MKFETVLLSALQACQYTSPFLTQRPCQFEYRRTHRQDLVIDVFASMHAPMLPCSSDQNRLFKLIWVEEKLFNMQNPDHKWIIVSQADWLDHVCHLLLSCIKHHRPLSRPIIAQKVYHAFGAIVLSSSVIWTWTSFPWDLWQILEFWQKLLYASIDCDLVAQIFSVWLLFWHKGLNHLCVCQRWEYLAYQKLQRDRSWDLGCMSCYLEWWTHQQAASGSVLAQVRHWPLQVW